MSDPVIPNCVVTVHYFESTASFSYSCASCSTGWQVQANGNIHPPTTGRVIMFTLKGYPTETPFAGLQFASDPGQLSNMPDWTPITGPSGQPSLNGLGIGLLSPAPQDYPAPAEPIVIETLSGPLIFDLSKQTGPLFYRLAVIGEEGLLKWDDPKIYDDGTG